MNAATQRRGTAATAWLGGGERQQQLGSEAGHSNHRLSAHGSGRLARAAQLGLPIEHSARGGQGDDAWPAQGDKYCNLKPQIQHKSDLNINAKMPARTLEQTRKPEIPSTPNRSKDQILGINSNPNL